MKTGRNYKFWFCTGSQDLYGDECLRKVAEHSRIIVEELNKSGVLPFELVWKPTLITNELIRKTFNEANADEDCAGVITWMHTFSPAKSWILGLKEYRKPLCHLHTQFNEEIPYDTIDMDFMNENQSAHGGREYGHIVSRMGIERKVIVGHWADKEVQERLASWMRTAVGIMESSHIRVCRVADNMRNVAVTEGDKVEAQIKFGWEVDAYPVNEIADYVKDVAKGDVDALVDEYYSKYDILLEGRDPEEFKRHVAVQAQIEIGFEKFLEEKNYQAIVTHFGDLGALQQLPGLAIQRLMEKGYGFGAEGDWKTAAMVRLMKIMTAGVKDAKGTSMMVENIFENRYKYVNELTRMGAKITVEGKVAIVKGVRKLSGAEVNSTDLRGGAALVTAALAARGKSKINNIEYILRGYENLDKKLKNIGAKIKIEK